MGEGEISVIVEFSMKSDFGTPRERSKFQAAEADLCASLEDAGAGEWLAREVGGGVYRSVFSTDNADRACDVISKVPMRGVREVSVTVEKDGEVLSTRRYEPGRAERAKATDSDFTSAEVAQFLGVPPEQVWSWTAGELLVAYFRKANSSRRWALASIKMLRPLVSGNEGMALALGHFVIQDLERLAVSLDKNSEEFAEDLAKVWPKNPEVMRAAALQLAARIHAITDRGSR